MNKTEAAAFLGVSVRSLENYTAQGLLLAGTVRGKTRPLVDYAPEDLQAFKNERDGAPENATASLAIAVPERTLPQGTKALAKPDDFITRGEMSDWLIVAFSLDAKRTAPLVSLDKKHSLHLDEAAELSGFPKDQIRRALVSGELFGKKIGRGWKVKPFDLEMWVTQRISE